MTRFFSELQRSRYSFFFLLLRMVTEKTRGLVFAGVSASSRYRNDEERSCFFL